jgi:hypothetical protein
MAPAARSCKLIILGDMFAVAAARVAQIDKGRTDADDHAWFNLAASGWRFMRISPLVAVLLAGCATLGGDIDAARNSWHGARYDDVVAKWGAPARQATLSDGRDVYTWESTGSGGVLSPGSVGIFGGSGVGVGVVLGLPGMGGGDPQRCERTLTFSGGRVVQQTWLGPPAFCSTFRRE